MRVSTFTCQDAERGTYKTVKARFWSWLSGGSPQNLSNCSLFARKRMQVPTYLTESLYQLVLESQLPHKIVNLLLTITNQNIKSTVLWGC